MSARAERKRQTKGIFGRVDGCQVAALGSAGLRALCATEAERRESPKWRGLVRLNFSSGEWERLQQEPLFQAAMQAIRTFRDAESVTCLGERLISLAKRHLKRQDES
jgi:hypothetical protein